MSKVAFTTAPPQQERTRRGEERILDALEAMFTEGMTFDEISVDDVAKRAGCSVGSLYHRFPSKVALLLHLYTVRIAEDFLSNLADSLDREFCVGKSVREVITGYFLAYLNNYRAHPELLKSVSKIVRFEMPKTDPSTTVTTRNSHRTLDYLTARLMERRAFIGSPNPEAAIELCDTTLMLAIRERVFFEKKLDFGVGALSDEELVNSLADVFVNHLQVREDEERIALQNKN